MITRSQQIANAIETKTNTLANAASDLSNFQMEFAVELAGHIQKATGVENPVSAINLASDMLSGVYQAFDNTLRKSVGRGLAETNPEVTLELLKGAKESIIDSVMKGVMQAKAVAEVRKVKGSELSQGINYSNEGGHIDSYTKHEVGTPMQTVKRAESWAEDLEPESKKGKR